MVAPSRVAGVILAAGRAMRMGALKQTMSWPSGSELGPTTIVASAFDAILPFCQRIFVVVGTDAAAVRAALGARVYASVDGDSHEQMLGSIAAGLRAATEGGAFDAVLLQPGDHPSVSPGTVTALLSAHRDHPRRAVMPEYRGKGGHPVLLPVAVIERVLSAMATKALAGGGLRQFWIDHPDACARIAVEDQSCVVDVDTPEAYARVVSRLASEL